MPLLKSKIDGPDFVLYKFLDHHSDHTSEGGGAASDDADAAPANDEDAFEARVPGLHVLRHGDLIAKPPVEAAGVHTHSPFFWRGAAYDEVSRSFVTTAIV